MVLISAGIFFSNVDSHSNPSIPKKYKNANLYAQSLVVRRSNPLRARFHLLAPLLPHLAQPASLVVSPFHRLVHPYTVVLPLCPLCPLLPLRQYLALLHNTCAAPPLLLAPDLSHLHER